MSALRCDLTLERRGFRLAVALEAPERGVLGVLGASGSGKTTLLRAIAGLEPAARGQVEVAGDAWLDSARGVHLPVHQRGLGYVPQKATLFEHLDVRGNLRFGLDRTPPGARRVSFEHVVEMLGLPGLLARRTHALSGGEAQRVAIGRALLTSPRLVLMDEPLTGLDLAWRRETLPYIERVRESLEVPMVYVSHSAAEIATLADQVLRLERGAVAGRGPALEFFAALDPAGSNGRPRLGGVLEALVARHDDTWGLSELAFHGQTLRVPRVSEAPGARVRVLVRAHEVSVAIAPPSGESSPLNALSGTVRGVGPARADGYAVEVALDMGAPLCATLTRRSLERLALRPGTPVWAHLKAVALAHELGEG